MIEIMKVRERGARKARRIEREEKEERGRGMDREIEDGG